MCVLLISSVCLSKKEIQTPQANRLYSRIKGLLDLLVMYFV